MITVSKENDKLAIAKVHYNSWIETYTNLISSDYLEKLSVENSLKYFKNVNPSNILIAKENDEIVGYVKFGQYRSNDINNCGEIESIYILKQSQHSGIGKQLIKNAISRLDYPIIYLWVLETNVNAIKFYQHLGFKLENIKKEITLVTPVVEVRMQYKK